MTLKEILAICKKSEVKMIDFKFCDLIGAWQHFSVPFSRFDKSAFTDGIGFDGSSIRGFKEIEKSDMLLFPDIDTFHMDSFSKFPTGSFICNVFDPLKSRFENDPRHIAEKCEKYLVSSGLADKAIFGPEAEFFIFDSVSFNMSGNSSFYEVTSEEANWPRRNPGEENICNGYKIRSKEGYFPVAPLDRLADVRREMVLELEKAGIETEKEHHEVASGGQGEIGIKYDSLLKAADKIMLFKYVVKNTAVRNGKTVTFMPKPIFGDNGSGMHVHISLWKNGSPLFYDKAGYAGLSKTAIYFIGGLLKHSPALMAFAAPTTNSYKRLVPGYEAPVNLAYSKSNRSAAIRIPDYSDKPSHKRIEFRPPDPSANPYLAFSAILLAGLDGIKNKTNPGDPFDSNIFEMSGKESKVIRQVPDSLDKSLNALENDHNFLMTGNVFTKDVIETWCEYKRKCEYDTVRLRPTPTEFTLYYDV